MRLARYAAVVAISTMMTCPAFAADQMKEMRGHGMQSMSKDGMMQAMMSNPHHKLGMAYKKNLQTFARTLKSDVTSTGKVDKEFAATAVNEMRQNLKQMEMHHREMQDSLSPEMKEKMGEMVKMMESRFATINQHLDLLEKEVQMENPDPKKVVTEVDQIMKQCEMMKMKAMSRKKK